MKLRQPSLEIVEQGPTIDGIYKNIEKAGRLCYASESTEMSAIKFVDNLMHRKHLSVAEHGTVYLTVEREYVESYQEYVHILTKYAHNPYSKLLVGTDRDCDQIAYITTNYRVMVENEWLDDLRYISESTEFHERRVSVLFHTDRITGESFLRHRNIEEVHLELHELPDIDKDFSFARQSTRYCNYGKDKFDNQVTFVIPSAVEFNYNTETYYDYADVAGSSEADCEWMRSCLDAEKHYFNLLKYGWTPENARYALGFSVYSPLFMTGYLSDWKHFFELRTHKSAHPDARELTQELCEKLNVKFGGYFSDICW